MITINNNSIIFSKDEKYYEYLRRYLVKIYLIKNTNYFKYTATRTFTKYNIPEIDEQVNSLNRQLRQRPFDKGDQFYDVYYIYNLDDDDNLIVPIGLMEFVKPFFSKYVNINYNLNDRLIDTNKVISSLSDKLLDGITLREEQMKAIKLCLTLKRTIIQMGTGAGKSEVMCGFIKSIQNETGECPTTLLLEPTDKLKNEMIERFQKYGINAIDYGKKRQIIKNAVNITHPMSLNNDLEKDKNLLKDIKIYMCDECHHSSCTSYMTTILNIPSAEYTIGVSASAVSQEHIGEKNIANYDINEIETMSMIGTVSMNVTAADLIKGSKLAKPVLLIVNNLANEVLDKKKQNDWHEINKKKLQSPKRTREIAEMSVFFSKRNRKTLILVNTKDYAYNIAKVINELGLNDQCRLSFGGKVFLKYNSTLGEFEKDDSDTFEDYRSGKISILIGTQHLVEGVDVPSLDTVILAYCGKSERIQIQSCGRVLRLTKNGNMAYIVDFSDCKDPILSYQFKTRLKTYLTTIGVNRNDVYVINPEKIEEETSIIFNMYEN